MLDKYLIPIGYMLLVYLEVATSLQHIYPVVYNSKYYIGIAIIFAFFVVYIIRNQSWIILNKKVGVMALALEMPMLIAYVYSLISSVLFPIEYEGLYSRAFGLLVYSLIAIMQAVIILLVLKEKAVDYTFVAISLNYFTSIYVAFKQGGTSQFIRMLTDTNFNGSVLEMHEVAPIIAMFAVYYWYCLRFRNTSMKKILFCELVCFVVILFSRKRIVLLSLFILFVLLEVFHYLYRKRNSFALPVRSLLSITGWGMLAVMYLFVGVIKSGILYRFMNYFHINSMARSEFWTAIEGEYSFSPIFFGHGLGYVSKWMDNNWMNLGIAGLTQSIGIHNDILKYYIDLGFIFFGVFFYCYLILNTKLIDKLWGLKCSVLYFTIMVLQFLIYFTDNISIYHNYQWVMQLIIISMVFFAQKSKREL